MAIQLRQKNYSVTDRLHEGLLSSTIRFSGFQGFKDIFRRQLEIYIRAFFIGAKFDDGCFFLGANTGIVNRSWHVTEIPCPGSNT